MMPKIPTAAQQRRHFDKLEKAIYKRITAPHDCNALAEKVNLAFGKTGMACKQCGNLVSS